MISFGGNIASAGIEMRQLFLCLVLLGTAARRAQSREHERRLSELDREYLAPETPILNAQRQKCAGIQQLAPLKGEWVKHPDHNYRGMTDPKTCPDFVKDYDCRSSDIDTKYHSLQQKEFRKVFRPFACDLHAMNATLFAQCLKGQRLIIVGDSTMRQVFQSLACLLHKEIVEGYMVPWEEATPNQTSVPFEKEYFIRDTETPILKQNVGMFKLKNDVEVHYQSVASFNISLWDDMLEKFEPLTKEDILFLEMSEARLNKLTGSIDSVMTDACCQMPATSQEFGAWYPRYAVWDMHKPWERYQKDVHELLDERLRSCGANVLWRAYGPTHFGTDLGAFTGISLDLKDMPKQEVCEPAKHGEYYYDTEVMKYLKQCGESCAHIDILPIYHLSLPAHNSHHGSFGRGISKGGIDCRHYCANVVDTWNQVLYNKLCFLPQKKGVESRQLQL